jgi:hypothetical protein
MPVTLDRYSAKAFFDEIKTKRNLQPGVLQLSWWLMGEIKTEFKKKMALTPAPPKSIQSPLSNKLS